MKLLILKYSKKLIEVMKPHLIKEIITALVATGSYFLGWWPTIWTAMIECLSWLVTPFSVPLGLVILIFILAMVLVFSVLNGKYWNSSSKYIEDEYLNLIWTWKLNPKTFFSWDHKPLCPLDLMPVLEYRDRHGKLFYDCEGCGRRVGPFNHTHLDAIESLERQIEGRLRYGNWKCFSNRIIILKKKVLEKYRSDRAEERAEGR